MKNRDALVAFLEHKAYLLRKYSLEMTTQAGSGHPTSCLSAADIVAALFFYAMRYNPSQFNDLNNDRFILSKGHASPLLYAAWAEVGLVTHDELMTYRRIDSVLEGHPTPRFAYTEAATGSLGMGLSIGAGMALSMRRDHSDARSYVVFGDAESAEGSMWEAAEIAAFYKLNNLIAIMDCNRLGQSTEGLHEHHVQRYADKYAAFGWHTIVIDGHDMHEIMHALDKARAHQDSPTMIIAKTFKGHGVSLFENKQGFHGMPLSAQQLPLALEQLAQRFPAAASYAASYSWQPSSTQAVPVKRQGQCVASVLDDPHYALGELIAPRKAYGQALVALGRVCEDIVVLDAEVKNSTYAEFFEAKFPERFVQCFVAEQNMVSMGVGFNRQARIPFISTFAAFFSRAYDQIRMASVGQAALRLVGSHVGVSIGQDGPSQMGLEDIALIAAVPQAVVVYPSDAVSTYKLTAQMAGYHNGISYMRTTRMPLPVLYPLHEEFPLGGCKILRDYQNAQACILGAGVTLHEALKAHDILQQQGINVTVIDAYSIKPFPTEIVRKAVAVAGNRLITVEDHYLHGGLGQTAVYALRDTDARSICLAVTQTPRSGKPEELLAWAGIDAQAIVAATRALLG